MRIGAVTQRSGTGAVRWISKREIEKAFAEGVASQELLCREARVYDGVVYLDQRAGEPPYRLAAAQLATGELRLAQKCVNWIFETVVAWRPQEEVQKVLMFFSTKWME